MNKPLPSVLIVDGHHMVHRMYHALDLITSKGESSGVFYGFFRTLTKVVNLLHPHKVVVVFDGPRYKEKKQSILKIVKYKGQREEDKPDNFFEQLTDIQRALRYAGVPIIRERFVESDDAIAMLCKMLSLENIVTIISSDKDMLQLIDKQVRVYDDMQLRMHTFETVRNPKLIIDYKSVVGDPSDNIPGIKGVGKKTYLDVLELFQHEGVSRNNPVLPRIFRRSLFKGTLHPDDVREIQYIASKSKFAKYFTHESIERLFECLQLVLLPSPLCAMSKDTMMRVLRKRELEIVQEKNISAFKALCLRWEAFTLFTDRALKNISKLAGETYEAKTN